MIEDVDAHAYDEVRYQEYLERVRPKCPECDDCDCYDADDPKSPTFHERYAELSDAKADR